VLFADLKGSMELLADRDPEEARKILDPVLELMMEAVHRYEGTVNQVMGDGIMALFGAPVAHEDHAVRACFAALRMQESVGRYSDEVRRVAGVPVSIRVGVNSGEVVVRSIGSDLHMDYTAVGMTTHLAARMEQAALPGSIVIASATLRLAEGYVHVRALGPIQVKGLPNPLDAYEVIGATSGRTRFQATASRGLTRFVGRHTELEALSRAVIRTATGHGEIISLVGEPGVGKSRLVWELTHSPRTQGWLVLESGSVPYGKTTAYRPVIDLLKVYLQIEDGDDWRRINEKLTAKVLTLDRALEPVLPALRALLDVSDEDPEWQALDPPRRRQRILDACKRVVLRESQIQPVLLVFEDLHWIDTETQAFIDGLVEILPTARLLLVVNYRPEYDNPWADKTHHTSLRIDPLDAGSATELLEALLGNDDDRSLDEFRRFLIERSEGNPFFLEESIRTLSETHVLVGERGAYRLAKPLAAFQVPTTVQAVLAARIDRLSVEDKRLLQCAAVLGKDVPFVLLKAIANTSPDELDRSLRRLQAAEFLDETSLFPEVAYTFKHALTHDVAYGGLLHEHRRILHARIVEAIEKFYGNRFAEQIEYLARHALLGEVWTKAVSYLRSAGAKAQAHSANREAVAWFEQALVALARLPESRSTQEREIDLRFDLRNSLVPLGELNAILTNLREAEKLATTLDDPRRLGWVSIYMSAHLWQTHDSTEAREFAQRAKTIADDLGDFALQVAANFYLGQADFVAGDYRRAEHELRTNVLSLQREHSREAFGLAGLPVVMSGSYLAWALAERGEFKEGVAHGEIAVRMAEAADHAYTLVLACWRLASVYVLKGDFAPATRLLERAFAVSRETNLGLLSPYVMGSLGHVYAQCGRLSEGVSALSQALQQFESKRLYAFHSLVLVYLGEACVIADRPDDAIAFSNRALGLTRERRERGWEAYALRLQGRIASDPNRYQAGVASDRYQQAMVLASELGMRPLVAHCHLGLGKLYRRTGKREPAQEHLTTATTMYREMDMRFWLEQAEAGMGA